MSFSSNTSLRFDEAKEPVNPPQLLIIGFGKSYSAINEYDFDRIVS